MKTSVFAIITVFVFSAMFIGNSNAQGMTGKKQFMRQGQRMGAKMFEALKLTDTQKDKINSLRDSHQKAMIDLKAQLQKDMLSLKELRVKENVTRDEVLAAVEKLNKSRDAIAIERANHLYDVREVLTPEQRKIFKDKFPGMMMNHRKGMRSNRKGMGMRGQGNF